MATSDPPQALTEYSCASGMSDTDLFLMAPELLQIIDLRLTRNPGPARVIPTGA